MEHVSGADANSFMVVPLCKKKPRLLLAVAHSLACTAVLQPSAPVPPSKLCLQHCWAPLKWTAQMDILLSGTSPCVNC